MIFSKFQKILISVFVISAMFFLTACSSSDDTQNFVYKTQLKSFQSCDELTTYLVETSKQQQLLVDYFQSEVTQLDSFQQDDTVEIVDNSSSDNSELAAPSTDSSQILTGYTGTNNQVEGVDEADFVKTDGEYTYLVTGGYFIIIDNFPAAESQELARVKLEGETVTMSIYQDVVWIVNRIYSNDLTNDSLLSFPSRVNQLTQVSIYDVSDRSAPQLLRESIFEGNYVDARRIDNRIFMVSSANINIYPLLESSPNPLVNDLLPELTDKLYTKDDIVISTELISDCGDIYRPETANGTATMSILSFDLAQPQSKISRQTIISNFATVYANQQHLYLATREDNHWTWLPVVEGDEKPKPGTTFHKFELAEKPVYVASGRVDGNLINQFAMDEYNNLLRTVTTVSEWWNDGIPQNTLYVLEQSGNELIQRSVLTNLGKPGERIYAARFIGDKGFLVTFEQIDPLYTLDLSDPDNPQVAGELEVPGFSTYLHPLGDNLLLAIGRSEGNSSLDLSLFDTSNFSRPDLLHRISIGDGSYSEAEYNHKAFTWFPQEQILAIPLTRWQGDISNDGFNSYSFYSGLELFKIDQESGFEKVGEVDHSEFYRDDEELRWYYPENIRRSFFTIDNNQNSYLYSISSRGMKVNALPDLETLATLPLPVYEWQDDILYW